jgi:hypothetical protein
MSDQHPVFAGRNRDFADITYLRGYRILTEHRQVMPPRFSQQTHAGLTDRNEAASGIPSDWMARAPGSSRVHIIHYIGSK